MKHLGLFEGIGGFSIAAKEAGWQTVAMAEKEPYCRAILKQHFPDARIIKDVRDVYRFTHEMNDLYDDGDVMWCDRHDEDFSDCECIGCTQWEKEIGQIDIITGGFPCVDITNAKNAIETPKGLSGAESGLWYEYKRIIGHLRPKYAIVENSANINVRGLYSIIGDFTELRYDCFWFTVPASRVGASHRRRRTFIVANANEQGLEGNVCKELAGEVKRRYHPNACRSDWWSAEPELDRVANGASAKLDKKKERLTALGNMVVPQVVLPIFKAIDFVDKSK